MTLGGLALSVGIPVDEATVTIENIHRHMEYISPGRCRANAGKDSYGNRHPHRTNRNGHKTCNGHCVGFGKPKNLFIIRCVCIDRVIRIWLHVFFVRLISDSIKLRRLEMVPAAFAAGHLPSLQIRHRHNADSFGKYRKFLTLACHLLYRRKKARFIPFFCTEPCRYKFSDRC